MANLLVCKVPYTRYVNGRRCAVRVGDIVAANDPVVRGVESRFVPIDSVVKDFGAPSAVVETATAAPGELRTTPKRGRPKKVTEEEFKPVVGEEKKESKDDA